MGRIVTQKRSIAPQYSSKGHRNSTDPSPTYDVNETVDVALRNLDTLYPSVQTTTSFRSGGEFTDPDPVTLLRENNFLTPYDNGHEFATESRQFTVSHRKARIQGTGLAWLQCPLVLQSSYYGGQGGFIVPSGLNMSYGARAIAATTPTKSIAGLAQFLGELHEGLPRLVGQSLLSTSRYLRFRQAGSEYLNVQFGWLPFINDIQKMCRAIISSNEVLKQYQRDSGKFVRRNFSFPEINSTSYGVLSNSATLAGWPTTPNFYANTAGMRGVLENTRTSIERYKFSGAFSYFLNADDSFAGRLERYAQLANKLLSIRLTPDVLWELTPWSWFIDWFADIGVIVTNASRLSQDGLVLRYSYLMRETVTRNVFSLSNLHFLSGDYGVITNAFLYTKKERVKGTPFGFGLNPGSFTDRQWSILGALGLTKAPKTLW